MAFGGKAKPKRILIVEDDWAVLEVLKLMLEDDGHVVVTAKHGRDAIKLAQSKPFDMLLTDISMPGTSGIDVARALRAEPRTANILIAIHTGLDEHWVRDRFDDYDLFLTKAADTDVLVGRIAKLLDQPPRARVADDDTGIAASAITTDELLRAQASLRRAMGLGPVELTIESLVEHLRAEIEQMRKLGHDDAEIARLLGEAIGRPVPIAALEG